MIKTLFLDIGGVLLTNGWDREARKQSAVKFGLDLNELEDRHRLIFNTYESGKLTLDDYLEHLLFYKKQKFPAEAYKEFMIAQSQPLDGALDYFKELKKKHGLKVVALSNEVKELNEYRIEKYKLNELFDFYISSCYVHLRKPDPDIFKLACDTSQTKPQEGFFVDDRLLYIEMAAKLGIPGHHYHDVETIKTFFQTFEL